MYKWLSKLHIKFVNSNFWFYLYYKHSKQHKKDLADVEARNIAFRERVLAAIKE